MVENRQSDGDIEDILGFLVSKVNDGTMDRLQTDYGKDERVWKVIQWTGSFIMFYSQGRDEGLNLESALTYGVSHIMVHPYTQEMLQLAFSQGLVSASKQPKGSGGWTQ